jgi:hypothetical protein
MIAVMIEVNRIVGLTLNLNDLISEASKLGASDKFKGILIKELDGFDVDPIAGTKAMIGGNETFKAKKFDLDSGRVESFLKEYKSQLERTYSPDTHLKGLDDTFNRMAYAILDGTFSKDSEAIKATCKVLKVKFTYKAIKLYLKGEL